MEWVIIGSGIGLLPVWHQANSCTDWLIVNEKQISVPLLLVLKCNHFVNVLCQWEMMLHCNVVSHWLWAHLQNDHCSWTNAALLSIGLVSINFKEISTKIVIQMFSHMKMHFKMSSANCQPFCTDPGVLSNVIYTFFSHNMEGSIKPNKNVWLTLCHWLISPPRVPHTLVSRQWTGLSIGSGNGVSPVRRQAII